MYLCNKCKEYFNELVQVPQEDGMLQMCPICNSENVKMMSQFTDKEKLIYIREKKLERVLEDENNISVVRKYINN